MICVACSKEFEKKVKHQVHCSEECSRTYRINYLREYRKRNQKVVEILEVKKPKPTMSIEQINRLAKELGLSYGEYVLKEGL